MAPWLQFDHLILKTFCIDLEQLFLKKHNDVETKEQTFFGFAFGQ